MQRILLLLLCLLPLTARPSDTTAAAPEIIHTQWYSHHEQIERRVDIYIPSQLKANSQKLTALYLIHGINGYEGAWQDRGNAVDTLAAMIANGRCEPMILVMPDCNKWPLKERPVRHGNAWKCVTHYPKLSSEHELEYAVSDLIDRIDTMYSVSSDCMIAGLSDGARIAANVANARPDKIRVVGLFSPVLHKHQLPKDSTQQFTIYVGKNDIFKANGKRFHRRMMKAGYPHQYIELKGGHTWCMWRNCLSDFLEKRSKKEPIE